MSSNHIKLNSKLSSVAAFWQPDSPDVVMTGNLIVDDKGIHFITSPQYAKGSEMLLPNLEDMNLASMEKTDVLHGFFDQGDCTLLFITVTEQPGLISYKEEPESIISTAYRAVALVTGLHTGSFDDRCIDSARYTFTSVAEWLIRGLNEQVGEKDITIRIPLQSTEILDFCTVTSRIRIQLKVHHELTTNAETSSRLIRPVVFIEITPSKPEALSWFAEIGNRLENLFSLLTGTSLGMDTLFIYHGQKSGTVIKKQHEHIRSYDFFDSVRCTHSQLAHSLATWVDESEYFREIENLLLGVLRKGRLFDETEFLSLAQALEGFHRATAAEINCDKAAFKNLREKIAALIIEESIDEEMARRVNSAVSLANQTSLRSRLKELSSRIGVTTLAKMQITPEDFSDQVVRTRNTFTHAGSSHDKKKESLRGSELFLINHKMRALLRGVFLIHLGFPEEQIADLIIREATKWKVYV